MMGALRFTYIIYSITRCLAHTDDIEEETKVAYFGSEYNYMITQTSNKMADSIAGQLLGVSETGRLLPWPVLNLTTTASWLKSVNQNLAVSTLMANIIKDLLNGILRSLGWIILGLDQSAGHRVQDNTANTIDRTGQDKARKEEPRDANAESRDIKVTTLDFSVPVYLLGQPDAWFKTIPVTWMGPRYSNEFLNTTGSWTAALEANLNLSPIIRSTLREYLWVFAVTTGWLILSLAVYGDPGFFFSTLFSLFP